jgi:hypothetical protein
MSEDNTQNDILKSTVELLLFDLGRHNLDEFTYKLIDRVELTLIFIHSLKKATPSVFVDAAIESHKIGCTGNVPEDYDAWRDDFVLHLKAIDADLITESEATNE